jgi:predicted Zn finger-like uncharacterized protein
MLIECPNCNAGFQVQERLLVDRTRPLRCGQCQTVFPVPEPPAPEPMTWQEPEPPPPPAAAPPPPAWAVEEPGPEPLVAQESLEAANDASSRGLRAAWAASIVLLIVGGLAAIIKREALVEAWPPATRLFSALGLM